MQVETRINGGEVIFVFTADGKLDDEVLKSLVVKSRTANLEMVEEQNLIILREGKPKNMEGD